MLRLPENLHERIFLASCLPPRQWNSHVSGHSLSKKFCLRLHLWGNIIKKWLLLLEQWLASSFSINPQAYRGGVGGLASTPIRFFLNFSKKNYYQDLPFSVAVRISLRHILTQVWWESFAMVTRYGAISSRWWNHFWRIRVFHLKCKKNVNKKQPNV